MAVAVEATAAGTEVVAAPTVVLVLPTAVPLVSQALPVVLLDVAVLVLLSAPPTGVTVVSAAVYTLIGSDAAVPVWAKK